ncbi:MAG: penicillin-binding protein [Cyclobacteriaceae bacterium]|nr:MAG: penicillin-binding protein [Cyclobacteriaceae bacterium]
MNVKWFTLLCVACAAQILAQNKAGKPDKSLAGLDAELAQLTEKWHAAGFAVAIVKKDKVIYAKGFGYRNLEKKLPVTPHTQFAVGSCTKAFTCALLGLLREDKKLQFDESPIQYIPELRFSKPEMNNLITIRDLMTHRTGLPRHDYSWYLFPAYSRDSLVMRIAHQEPFAAVREKYYYNNFMFLLQGVIAERLTGKSWEENISSFFFEPLQMKSSTTTIDGLRKGAEAATGYAVKNKTTIEKMDYYDIAGMGPAGSINSSVTEMANWVITWINGGRLNGKQILPEGYVKEAISSHTVVNASPPDKETPDILMGNYGYGWFISAYKGHYRVEHGGNIDGFSANVSFFPSDSIGIVVLTNQNGSVLPSLVRNLVADRMLGLKRTDWNSYYSKRMEDAEKQQEAAKKAARSAQKNNTRYSHSLYEYAGTYYHPGYGTFNLTAERDSLFAKTKHKTFWLKHYHYDVFIPYEKHKGKIDTTASINFRFNFITDENGDIASALIKLEPAVDALEFKRTPLKTEVNREVLTRYTGEYELPGVTVRFYLKGQEAILYLLVPGQPEYELIPIGKNMFAIKGLDGFKVQFTEAADNITEAAFIQPNGTFVAKRK